MNIGMIYQAEYPPLERIEKEARSLTRAGHKVFLLSNNYGRFPQSEEAVDELWVSRIKPNFKNKKLCKILKFPVFLNPLWALQLLGFIKKHHIEVLQVVDIPLSLMAIGCAKWFHIPVVLDMWEHYPELLKGSSKVEWGRYIYKNYKVAEWVEKITIKTVDLILTVVEEQKERLATLGANPDKIFVVSNTVDLETFLNFEIKPTPVMDEYKDYYKLLYIGGFQTERGLDQVIKAMKYVAREIPRVQFILAGEGHYENYLKELVQKENVAQYVKFVGWVKFQEIPSYILQSDLCLVPHVYNEFINTTIPNKIFQYMALGKPVLVSHARPLARIVREADCGFVFESGNIHDLAEKIIAAKNANLARLGRNGKAWVEKKYNWNETSKNLIHAYDSLAKRIKAHSG